MDWVTGAVADPRSSAENHGSSAGTGWGSPDESVVSAFTKLDLDASPRDHQRTPAAMATEAAKGAPFFGQPGQKQQQCRGVATDQMVGPAETATVPSTNPPKAVGRGRGMTLPAWMTEGSAAMPGTLQQQAPLENISSAQANRPTGLYVSRPRPKAPSGQSVDPDSSDKTTHVKKNSSKNKSKSKDKKTAEMGAFLVGADTTGSDSSWASTAGDQGPSSLHAKAGTYRGQESTPLPAPIAGVSVESPARSPSTNSLPAGGRGRGRTVPSWMTAGAKTSHPGGLLRRAIRDIDPMARVPGQTGWGSSCPEPSSQRVAQSSGINVIQKTENNAYERSQISLAAGKCAFHVGARERGSTQSQAPATGGSKSSGRQKKIETLRGHNPAPTHTAGLSVAKSALRQQKSRIGAGRGRGMTLPAWMNVPSGLQPQEPLAKGGSVERVPRPTGLCSSRPQQGSRSPTINNDKTSTQKILKAKTKKMEPEATGISTHQPQTSETAGPESNVWNEKADTVDGQNPASAATERSDRAPRKGTFTASSAAYCEKISTAGSAEQEPSRVKRILEEEPATTWPALVRFSESDFPPQHQEGLVQMMDAVRTTASIGPQPLPKKSKAVLSETSPPKTRVATRARFKILHHHALPNQRQLVVRGSSSPAMTIVTGQQKPNDVSNEPIRSLPARAPISPKPSPAVHANQASPSLVVIDGRDITLTYWGTGGRWSILQPLLAIQFFKELGVPCVAFLPRERINEVSPQDDFYTAFQDARTSGAISEIPPGVTASIFILKHAVDNGAYVVTNGQLLVSADKKETLAFLGKTREDLQAYVSHYHVRYKFVHDEFTPNPEAPLITILTKRASAESCVKQATPDGGGPATPTVLPPPPPRPPV